MSMIIIKYITKYKLNKDINNEKFKLHRLELLKFLIDETKRDKNYQHLQDKYNFNKEQISILISF